MAGRMSKPKKRIEKVKTVQIGVETHSMLLDHCKREGLKLNWFVDRTMRDKIKPV